jgi:diguanylate cyclase
MGPLAYIAPWVLGSVGVGLAAGFFLGHSRGRGQPDDLALQRERQATLKMLVDLLGTAERISNHVDTHNSEIRENADQVGSLQVSGEMEVVRLALLRQMTALLSSNKRLQDDLLCTRYRLEEQAQEIDHVRREARIDELTGVANRKAFNEKLHLLVSTWHRERHPFTLMLADLDQFKWINDAHGHQAGDRVLETVGNWLREWLREGDFVGRYGGDEFAVLLPYTELDVGRELAEMVRSQTADKASRVAVRGEQVSVSLSIGVAAAQDGDTAETLLQRADEALYHAKRLGRNQVQCAPVPAADCSAPDAEPAELPA